MDAGVSPTKRRVSFDGGTCVVEWDGQAKVLRVELGDAEMHLAGNASALALATKVHDENQAIKSELQSLQSGLLGHSHLAGTLVAPPGIVGGPVTGATGTPTSAPYTLGYEPGDVGAQKVRSA